MHNPYRACAAWWNAASPAGAAAGASVVVLKQFCPVDAAAIDAELEAQRTLPPLGNEHNKDFDAGVTVGVARVVERHDVRMPGHPAAPYLTIDAIAAAEGFR
jgi:hypothetical protein